MPNRNLSSADLHIHTTASDGTATPGQVLDWVAEHTNLRVIAICDHNTVSGALKAAELVADYPFEVIVGQETDSCDGHILGLWAPERIEPGRSAAETIADIHTQGGIAIAAHPFAPRWWHKHGLCRGERTIYDATDYDGFECANSTPLLFFANLRARAYQRRNRHRFAATGGSDAHILEAIGTSRTLFEGESTKDLRRALERRTTVAYGPVWSPTRAWRYLRKAPEIKLRNTEMRAREAREATATTDPAD